MKRARFNPAADPEDALREFNRVAPELTSAERASALQLLTEFVVDQAAVSHLVVDCETSELIARGVPIAAMSATVTCASFVDPATLASTMDVAFWPPATGRGAPYAVLAAAMDAARTIVAYNGRAFDLVLLARDNLPRLERWRQKTHDPYALLKEATRATSLKLGALLAANDLAPKSGAGAEAPTLWKRGVRGDAAAWDALERYCAQDVRALLALVALPEVVLPSGRRTRAVSLRPAGGSARDLVQGSAAWFAARRGRITASVVPSLLGFGPGVADEAWERLLGIGDAADTADMQRGRRLEDEAAAHFAARVDARVERTGLWTRELDGVPVGASPDRLVYDGRSPKLLEIKAPRALAPAPRESTILQAHVQLFCAQMDVCYLAQYAPPRLLVHRVAYDSELLDVVADALRPVAAELQRDVPVEDKVLPFLEPRVRAELRQRVREARDAAIRVGEYHV